MLDRSGAAGAPLQSEYGTEALVEEVGTDWPLMVLSVVFLVVYSWEILIPARISRIRETAPRQRGLHIR